MWGSWCEWCCPHERQTRGREEEDFDLDEREDSMVSVAAGLAHNLGCRIWVSLEFGFFQVEGTTTHCHSITQTGNPQNGPSQWNLDLTGRCRSLSLITLNKPENRNRETPSFFGDLGKSHQKEPLFSITVARAVSGSFPDGSIFTRAREI